MAKNTSKIWHESRSEPGLHMKMTKEPKVNTFTNKISGLIMLGKNNRGSSKLDGMTK